LDNEDWNDEEEKEKEKAELLADLLLLLERDLLYIICTCTHAMLWERETV
jgi:hypothetical protein